MIAGLSLGTSDFLCDFDSTACFCLPPRGVRGCDELRDVVLGSFLVFTRSCLQPHFCSPGAPAIGDPLNAVTSFCPATAVAAGTGRSILTQTYVSQCTSQPIFHSGVAFQFSLLNLSWMYEDKELELHEFIHLLDIQNVQEFLLLAACAKRW